MSWCATKPGDSDSHGRPRARLKSTTSPSWVEIGTNARRTIYLDLYLYRRACAPTARPPETPAIARAERPVAIGSARLAMGTCARATRRPTRARCDAGRSGSSMERGPTEVEDLKFVGDNWRKGARFQLMISATYTPHRVEVRLQHGDVLTRSLAIVHAVALIPAHRLALPIHPLVRPARVRQEACHHVQASAQVAVVHHRFRLRPHRRAAGQHGRAGVEAVHDAVAVDGHREQRPLRQCVHGAVREVHAVRVVILLREGASHLHLLRPLVRLDDHGDTLGLAEADRLPEQLWQRHCQHRAAALDEALAAHSLVRAALCRPRRQPPCIAGGAAASIRVVFCADTVQFCADARAVVLGVRAAPVGNRRASGPTLRFEDNDFVQAHRALCVAVPDELHGVVAFSSRIRHHLIHMPGIALVRAVARQAHDIRARLTCMRAVAPDEVPHRVVVRAKHNCTAHVDPHPTSSRGVKVRGVRFEVGAAAVRDFGERPHPPRKLDGTVNVEIANKVIWTARVVEAGAPRRRVPGIPAREGGLQQVDVILAGTRHAGKRGQVQNVHVFRAFWKRGSVVSTIHALEILPPVSGRQVELGQYTRGGLVVGRAVGVEREPSFFMHSFCLLSWFSLSNHLLRRHQEEAAKETGIDVRLAHAEAAAQVVAQVVGDQGLAHRFVHTSVAALRIERGSVERVAQQAARVHGDRAVGVAVLVDEPLRR
eukprot:scaffold37801_cov69-Phaeocystis_antarctica.AAC.2